MTDRARDIRLMTRAASLALRGHGGAEPNPLVGCVITDASGNIVGAGYHRRFGGPHAEVEALNRAGDRAAGGTAYVTLEPCSHAGKTPPCTEALIKAGVARVVIARRDPNPVAAGGAARLRDIGIQVESLSECEPAVRVTDPFAYRVRSGLPWVTAKWAQALDGRIATRTGESKWISGERSRKLVHRERGRVDVILTGIGTVLADDPRLTARDVRIRRVARRVVLDPWLRTPHEARIVTTAKEISTVIVCSEQAMNDRADHARALQDEGVIIMQRELKDETINLKDLLREMSDSWSTTNVLVEAGPGLTSDLFRRQLVNEAWVFVSPRLIGDDEAVPALRGREVTKLRDAIALRPVSRHVRGDDVVLRYRVGSGS